MSGLAIVFVAPRAWPAVGGMEAFLRHLGRDLAARHRVTVLAQGLDDGPRGRLADSLEPPPPFEPFTDGGVRVEPLRLSPAHRALLAPLGLQVVPGLRRYAYGRPRVAAARLFAAVAAPRIAELAAGADVVHMWGGGLLGAAAARAAHDLLGVPCVTTPFAHEGRWGDDRASAAAVRAADRVLALLETDAALYRALGVEPARIRVCGVCSPAAGGDGAALRRRHGIEGPLVAFLGVRRPYKGYDLLLEAAPLVAAARPEVTFAFLGPGPALPAGVGARCVDAGEVGDAERGDWLAAADLLCLPSESEILPVSILEAWSTSTAVVASDIPPLRELVADTGGGLVAAREPRALADALLGALADPERLRALGERGRAVWRECYSVEAVASLHEAVYAEVVGPGEARCAA